MKTTMNSSEKELDRIGGEAKLIVYHDDKQVLDAYFIATAPVRGFEKLVLGKNPLFVIEAVMRICGICHAAHGIASAEAFENALGIMPPPEGRRLREAIGLINRIQSHLYHLLLIIPDIVGRENMASHVLECIQLLNDVNDVMIRIGGAPTHPPNIVIGGVLKPPSEAGLREALRKISMVKEKYDKLRHKLVELSDNNKYVEELDKHQLPEEAGQLASHLFYGDRYNVDPDKVTTMRYEEYRGKHDGKLLSSTLVAMYDGGIVEAGPRSRLSLYRGYSGRSLWDLQRARFKEIELALDRVKELLENIRLTAPFRTTTVIYGYGRGVGVYEAPRGTLFHYVELSDEGRVINYKIVVPTMFNIPVMERSLKGVSVGVAEVIPRLFDPCIPCTTHYVRV